MIVESVISHDCKFTSIISANTIMKIYGKTVDPIKITLQPVISKYEIYNPKTFIMAYLN